MERLLHDPVILGAAIAFACLAIGFSLVFARLIARPHDPEPTEDLGTICSPTRYQPVEQFLKDGGHRLPFPDRNSERQLRHRRVQVLWGCLRQMSDDFDRIAKAIKFLMVHSQIDRPDIARVLLKQEMIFTFAMLAMKYRLTLYSCGLNGVDENGLTRSLYALRLQLQSLALLTEPSAA